MNRYKYFWERNLVSSAVVEKKAGIKTGTKEYFDYYDNNLRYFDNWTIDSDWYDFNSSKNKIILDIGCGNGWLSYRYVINGANVVVTDLSESAVRLSKSRFNFNVSMPTSGKIQFLSCDAQNLPFKSNYFDLVTCISVLHNVQDFRKAITEIARVCKKQGKIYLMVFYRNSFFFQIIVPILAFLRKKTKQEILNSYDGINNPLTSTFSKDQILLVLMDLNISVTDLQLRYLPEEHFPLFRFKFFLCLKRVLEKRIGFYLYIKGDKDALSKLD